MQFQFTKTYSAAREAGGDYIARKAFLKEHYELNFLNEEPDAPQTYPEKIFDTPEKAGIALHCMRIVMKSEPVYIEKKVLRDLAMDIESYSMTQPKLRRKYLENIVSVMGHIIESSEVKEKPIIPQAMAILEDMKSIKELDGFVLPINKKKYDAALKDYENPPEENIVEQPSDFSALLPSKKLFFK